jgi:hypothetical protein
MVKSLVMIHSSAMVKTLVKVKVKVNSLVVVRVKHWVKLLVNIF